ncbi:lipopolysaccharide/colanic/teichoic acid biosynthesis glycosyltransferase [Rhodobacter maris]|uniref:Lipopolysaccharide/colanic/teichoic acid biosynthesis glycosyltransferase n=2 Tax=Rhodobacter maris TaxID=446682 RepID=A0A285RXP9_9RHOB|nr:lipopolysaccharide/colanic/teichoic acid biosynthesis glycosyltransferase [Rhodobacter maris]
MESFPGGFAIAHPVQGPQPESLTRQRRDSSLYARYGKRLLDLGIAVLLLPVLLPVMAVIALLIRLDGHPALFVQLRVGRDGKLFRCYKFRSMVPDAERVLADMCARMPSVAAEWVTYQKLAKDPRITRVGKILRRTSLDELPQIFNVLKGDMSLVGPRPFLPAQKAIYDEAGGRAYYRLRPGVTGLWQVFSRCDTTFGSRIRFDEAYAANMSARGDLALILRTAGVVLTRTGA